MKANNIKNKSDQYMMMYIRIRQNVRHRFGLDYWLNVSACLLLFDYLIIKASVWTKNIFKKMCRPWRFIERIQIKKIDWFVKWTTREKESAEREWQRDRTKDWERDRRIERKKERLKREFQYLTT
jgi:hypothetical protein